MITPEKIRAIEECAKRQGAILHRRTGRRYTIIGMSDTKLEPLGWFRSVTYQCPETKKVYTRFINDFDGFDIC